MTNNYDSDDDQKEDVESFMMGLHKFFEYLQLNEDKFENVILFSRPLICLITL